MIFAIESIAEIFEFPLAMIDANFEFLNIDLQLTTFSNNLKCMV